MATPFIIGDDALIAAPSGTRLANVIEEAPLTAGAQFHIFAVTNKVIIAPSDEEIAGFKMPDIYDYYPDFVRLMDVNLVPRGDVPVYAWDSVPKWDTEPFTWDEVIGPEPILKAATRIQQLELEKTCQEIETLLTLYNITQADSPYLPYLAAQLGMPLPSASEQAQRSFLKNLAKTYRNKGTPASFRQLIESLGFDLTIVEKYQRKDDGTILEGPQIRETTSNLVLDEPVGATTPSIGPYSFTLLNVPIQRGSVRLKVYADSATVPLEVQDDGAGGWSDNSGGFVNYDTGRVELTLESPPGLVGQPITATYRYFFDQFPDPFNTRYTDRWRSSLVGVSLTPKNASVSLTNEIIDRLFLYFGILKPAHVILRNLDLTLSFEEEVGETDELQPIAFSFVESVFGNLYLGEAWAAEDNASQDPSPSVSTQHREGGEFMRKIPAIDDSIEPSEPPYTYPWTMNGKFTQPSAANDYEADWFDGNVIFTGAVTNDVSPTTTNFSIAKGAGTALGVGDTIVIEPDLTALTPAPNGTAVAFTGTLPSHVLPVPTGRRVSLRFQISGDVYEEIATATGAFTNRNGFISTSSIDFTTGAVSITFTVPLQAASAVTVTTGSIVGSGSQSVISVFADMGTYYDVTVSPALPVAPVVGAEMTVLAVESPTFNTLEAGNREEDPLNMEYGTLLTPTPDGVSTGPFTGTVDAGILPILVGSTITLRYSREASDIIADSVNGPFDLESINGGDPVDLRISVDGGAFQTITLSAGSFVDFGAATAAEVRDEINAVIGGLASVSGSAVRLTFTPTTDASTIRVGYRSLLGNFDANGANSDGTDVGSVLGFAPYTGVPVYTETATAPGSPGAVAFSNTNGHLSAASINTSTGAISVTFSGGNAPRSGIILEVFTVFGSNVLGVY